MIEKYVRPLAQKFFFDSFAQWLSRWISPNQMTWVGLLFGLFIPVALSMGSSSLALFCLSGTGLCDILDGTLARLARSKSSSNEQKLLAQSGAVIDIVADRMVEFAIILGLVIVDVHARALLGLWMLGSVLVCVTTFLVVGIFSPNEGSKSFHYSPGWIERPEAFLFFAWMIVRPSVFTPLALLFSLLVFLTGILRVREFLGSLKRLPH